MIRRIAALLACHNRRAKTLACLRSFLPDASTEYTLTVYLTDDGSSDGTAAAVRAEFPAVRVLRGDGSLYWAGGMRLAWDAAAREGDYDAYLWLNDDTLLNDGAIGNLVHVASRAAPAVGAIVAGTTADPATGRPTYGGYADASDTAPLAPSGLVQSCAVANGNILLVPRAVFRAMGNLDPAFAHNFADFDYVLRARAAGFAACVAPGLLGRCPRDPDPEWCTPGIPLVQRWRALHRPTGLPPREYFTYQRRHFGVAWLSALLKLYVRALLPGMWIRLRDARLRAHRQARPDAVAEPEW